METKSKKIINTSIGILLGSLLGINIANYLESEIFNFVKHKNDKPTNLNAKRILVDVEDYKVSNQGVLYPGGLSSCSVICLYDLKNKVGAMIHFPAYWLDHSRTNRINLEKIIGEMVQNGACAGDIRSMSLKYGLKNESEYISKYLENQKLKNKDLPRHMGEINSLSFDVEKGIIKFYRENSLERYTFTKR